jgi:arabinose-5-phosphate isomerase
MTRTSDVLTLTAGQVMTPRAITINRQLLAVEALKIMETHKITSVVVVDAQHRVEGVVHLHDLWRTQMI